MTLSLVLTLIATGLTGWLSWGFVEYGIHGLLSHRWRTFVSPLHWGHHEDPHAVFTPPVSWMPATLLTFAIGWILAGPAYSACFHVGLLAGFARYERFHWRIHFREPRNEHERTLRQHHLAHHYCNPNAYCGVTTRLWDRVFGTFPESWPEDYARVADRPLLEGPSNLKAIWSPFPNRS